MKSQLTKRILAVVITAVALSVLLALSSLAAVTGGYGSIDGLEDGKNYEAAEVTLNSTGDGTAIDTPFALDATTNKDLAGLYVVRETGTTDWSDVIYVYGASEERSKLGNWALNGSNKLMPRAVQGTDWIPGTWVSAAGSFDTSVWGSSANYYPLTANYIANVAEARELYTLEHTWEEAKEKLYLTNSFGYSSLKTFYDKHYEAGNGSSAYGNLKASSAGRAAELRQYVADRYMLRGFKYAFEPGEIISVNELLEFPMYLRSQQYCVYPGTAYAQAIFYVMDKTGNVTTHTWTSEKLTTGYQVVLLDTIIDVQLRSYNKRINKLRNVETATVIDGWATFTNYAMTYVIIEK